MNTTKHLLKRTSIVLWLLAVLVLILSTQAFAKLLDTEEIPPAPRVMTLPFLDFRIKVQQGWSEHVGNAKCSQRSCWGIDYVLGEYDNSKTWKNYDVVASREGEACANCGSGIGNHVRVTTTVDNQTFFSYYGHLREIDPSIPDHNNGEPGTVHVGAGQILGISGDTGSPNLIHLHFVEFQPITYDPYGLEKTRNYYYPGGNDYKNLGSRNYWTADPPSYPANAELIIEYPTETKPATVGLATDPDKFQIRIQAPSELDKSQFQVTVSSGEATIQTVKEVSTGVYELDALPPTQSSAGAHSISIKAGDRLTFQQSAVLYTDDLKSNVDVVLVLDRSGSMGGQKMTDAKNAAKQFIDFMSDGDKVGVASFSTFATINYGLEIIQGNVKQQAKDSIDLINASGNTSIGAGLNAGKDELTLKGDPSHRWAIVLLSDGQENTSPYVAEILPEVIQAGITVHTVGLGLDAEEALLQHVASATGGTYHFAPSSEQLVNIYDQISMKVSGQQSLMSETGSLIQGSTDEKSALVDSSIKEATFSVSWDGSDIDLRLRSPTGTIIDSTSAANNADIEYITTGTLEFYRIRTPEPGEWTLIIYGAVVDDPTGEAYSARVSARTNLALNTSFDRESYVTYNPINVKVSLSDSQAILNADVLAEIRSPSGISTTLPLMDDGIHADENLKDGIYANTFTNTSELGSYDVTIYAYGQSTSGETFSRLDRMSVFVEQSTVPQYDLYIDKTVPSVVLPGEDFEYKIQFGNNGPDTVFDSTISLLIPGDIEYIDDTMGGLIISSEGVLVWNVGSLSVGATESHSITLSVAPTAIWGSRLNTQLMISSNNGVGDMPDFYDVAQENNISTAVLHAGINLYLPILSGVH